MIPKLESLKLLKEGEITTIYKGVMLDIPENCHTIFIDYYDVGRLGVTEILHKIKYYEKQIESDEDYELRKEKLRITYHQEYLDKLKELENDK